MTMTITIEADELKSMLQRAPQTIPRRVGQLVERGAIEVQREMRIAANVGVTGDMRRSVKYTYGAAELRAIIEPTASHARFVEYGTRPHYVSARPGTPLARWAKMKGLNPYAVAKSIARKGTKPHPFVAPTYSKMKPRVEQDIERGVALIAQELDNGSL